MIKVFVSDSVISADILYSYADKYGKDMFDRALDKIKAYPRLLCRVLLIAAMKEYGIDFINEEKYKNNCGKEYLKNKNIFFNCSHTKHAAAVAIYNSEVGIDIEQIPDSVPLKTVKRYFSPSENKLIECSSYQLEDFCRLWTKKESYVKYLGTGFSTPFSSFSCTLPDCSEVNGVMQTTYRYKDNFITVSGGECKLITTENNFIKDGLINDN